MRRLGRWVERGLLALGVSCWAAASQAQTLTYDEQGRLSTAVYADGTEILYCYDLAGNRTQYTVATGTGSCPVPSPPVAHNVSATVQENSANNTIGLNVTGGLPASVAVSTAPTHGSAAASALVITYTPTPGFYGSDSFQYTATNAGGTSAPATAALTVTTTTLYSRTTAGSWSFTVPAGAESHVIVTCVGGGGGNSTTYGGLGGGGGTAVVDVAVTPGTTAFSGSVGAAGTSRANSGTAGTLTTCASTNSSPTFSMLGGGGTGANQATNGAGGTASGGTTNTTGATGAGVSPGSVTIVESNY